MGVLLGVQAHHGPSPKAALEQVQIPERMGLVVGHARRRLSVNAAHVVAREAALRCPADDLPLQQVVGAGSAHVGALARSCGEVHQHRPAVQEQRARVSGAGEAGEPKACDLRLAKPPPLFQLVFAVADDEPLALASRRVHLVELGERRFARLIR